MPTIAQLCLKECVWIKYKGSDGETISEIVKIAPQFHSYIKEEKPFKIASRKGLIGLVDMPGEDGGYWAAHSLSEFRQLLAIAKQRKEDLELQKAIAAEDNEYVRHKPRIDRNFKKESDLPYKRVIIFHNAFETNRRKH